MAGAYYEKIARINLTTGEIRVEPLDLELAHKFIGGRGLGTKMLYDEGIAAVDPLSPENKLIYITGPMTGAAAPSTGRYMVCTKSPLTGMIACSNSGGIWGAKLKYAGWDAIIVEGEAPDWTYINIVDDKIELLDAREYCGVMSEEMDEKLRAKHGAEASVLNIGPAEGPAGCHYERQGSCRRPLRCRCGYGQQKVEGHRCKGYPQGSGQYR